jgi:hypothetical protein
MNKYALIIAPILLVLGLGLSVSSQANSVTRSQLITYDTSKLIGLTVKSRDEVKLGQIFDLVADSSGHLDFALVDQPGFEEFPGRVVIVPIGTLRISKEGDHKISVVFNEDKEKFYEGPDYGTENLSDLKQAVSVDSYYGIQPSWTPMGQCADARGVMTCRESCG